MRVLHLIESLDVGGAERALVNTLPWLSRQGVESEVATLWGSDVLAPELEGQGYPVHRLQLKHRWNLRQGALGVAGLVAERSIDLVHSHLYFAGLYAGLGALVDDVPRAITFHNLAYAPGCNKPGPALWLRKLLNRLVVTRYMDGVVAVSDAVARHYRHHLGRSGIRVIPNGLDTIALHADSNLDKHELRRRYDIRDELPLLLMPGRLVPEKGHSWLLDACALLAQDQPNFQLLVIGSGPLEDQLRSQIANLGLEDRVTMVAALPQAELLRLMQLADMVLVPSLQEGFGLVAAEALCLQAPVIASRVGGLVELLDEECGVLVDPGDTRRLAAEMAKIIRRLPGELEESTARGRSRMERCYSMEQVAQELCGFYGELVG